MSYEIIDALNEVDPKIFDRLNDEITQESLYKYLKPIADAHAPSQSTAWTRAKVVEDLLGPEFLNRDNVSFIRNYENTGNTVFMLGNDPHKKKVWLMAHLDMITYLIEPEDNGVYPLTAICYDLMEPGERDAVALGFNISSLGYEIVTHGIIRVEDKEEKPCFIPNDAVHLHPGMRVCFHSELSWDRDTGVVRGSLDDAAGAAALIRAVVFLADYDIELLLGLTDEEEGKAGIGSQTICRGGARLPRYFDQPELVIASDIHEAAKMYGGGGPTNFRIGDGASFAEKSAHGLGEITPPHLYELKRKLAEELDTVGIRLRENLGGYLSRTEGINAMYRTPNISLMGFLGENRHFQKDVESANISDLVDLSKAIVCFALLTKTSLWHDFWKIQ